MKSAASDAPFAKTAPSIKQQFVIGEAIAMPPIEVLRGTWIAPLT
jgi:hypothetical protein